MHLRKSLFVLLSLALVSGCASKDPQNGTLDSNKDIIISSLENHIKSLQTDMTTNLIKIDETHKEAVYSYQAQVVDASVDPLLAKNPDIKGTWATFYIPDFNHKQTFTFETKNFTTMLLEKDMKLQLDLKLNLSFNQNKNLIATEIELLSITNIK